MSSLVCVSCRGCDIRSCGWESVSEHAGQREEKQYVAVLDLANNLISEVEGLDEYTSLLQLSLAQNQLQRLGWQLTETITHLDVSQNMLSDLYGIGCLQFLVWLDASYNTIKTAKPLKGCQYLRDLKLNKNKLKTLQGVEGLFQLECLQVRNNRIDKKGEIRLLSMLTSLKCLALEGNPVTKRLGGQSTRSYAVNVLPQLQILDGYSVGRNWINCRIFGPVGYLPLCLPALQKPVKVPPPWFKPPTTAAAVERKVHIVSAWQIIVQFVGEMHKAGCLSWQQHQHQHEARTFIRSYSSKRHLLDQQSTTSASKISATYSTHNPYVNQRVEDSIKAHRSRMEKVAAPAAPAAPASNKTLKHENHDPKILTLTNLSRHNQIDDQKSEAFHIREGDNFVNEVKIKQKQQQNRTSSSRFSYITSGWSMSVNTDKGANVNQCEQSVHSRYFSDVQGDKFLMQTVESAVQGLKQLNQNNNVPQPQKLEELLQESWENY